MATDDVLKTRINSEEKELFLKRCKLNGYTASDRIRWLVYHDNHDNNPDNIAKQPTEIIDNMFERVGFIRDELLITLSNSSRITYDLLKNYCKTKKYPIQLYDTDDTVPVEGTTTGWL